MKFEIQDKPAGVNKNGNLLWVITRQETPVENKWLESRGFDPEKYIPLPDDKDGKTKEMQGLADLIAKLPVEEADKVIKDIEDKLGIVYNDKEQKK